MWCSFVRTSSPEHAEVAREVFKRASDAGDIYLDTYSGWYNTREETFVPDGECFKERQHSRRRLRTRLYGRKHSLAVYDRIRDCSAASNFRLFGSSGGIVRAMLLLDVACEEA